MVQIAHLEAERNDVLAGREGASARSAGTTTTLRIPPHLLFVPGREGYRLVEQDGPPPAPGSTLELEDDDGSAVRLTVTKIGASPLPGTRLACAYLMAAA